jgi:methylenetetrahydrofolate dehydrogenase (NADP+) / methenyltetrahydrofolate cyclohydrolase
MNIIDGHKIADKIKDELARKIFQYKEKRPNLAIILVGQREDSSLYVKLKEKAAKQVGIDTHLYRLSETTREEEILSVIDFLNNDNLIDAILLQLPLPVNLNSQRIINRIRQEKEVDGLSSKILNSPVVSAIKASLNSINFADKQTACILYKSEEFGKSIKEMLAKEFKINILSNKDLIKADLVISALGKPNYIKGRDIKEKVVLIDIGISKIGTKVLGDIDYESVKNKASYITPVPGGIGPMTIAFLLENVWQLYCIRNNIK